MKYHIIGDKEMIDVGGAVLFFVLGFICGFHFYRWLAFGVSPWSKGHTSEP